MNEINKDFGKLNPNAPSALSRFAFLIGRWRCEAKVKLANGVSQTFPATWVGRYILDGYAIADEYRMTGSSGELIVLGLNFRVYDATKQIWKIKWLNALDGMWWDLGPEELGGVRFDGQSVTYSFREPAGARAYQRVTYTIDFCINNGIIGTGGERLCPDQREALIYWKIDASGL